MNLKPHSPFNIYYMEFKPHKSLQSPSAKLTFSWHISLLLIWAAIALAVLTRGDKDCFVNERVWRPVGHWSWENSSLQGCYWFIADTGLPHPPTPSNRSSGLYKTIPLGGIHSKGPASPSPWYTVTSLLYGMDFCVITSKDCSCCCSTSYMTDFFLNITQPE